VSIPSLDHGEFSWCASTEPRFARRGRDVCVTRVAKDGNPALERSMDCVAQWSPRACAQHGLRSAMGQRPSNNTLFLVRQHPSREQKALGSFSVPKIDRLSLSAHENESPRRPV
jgi:hypothetical protein